MTSIEEKKDSYCWVCHKDGSAIFCPKCFSGFHFRCAEKTKESINNSDKSFNKMCLQCTKIERSRHLYTSSHDKFNSISKKMLNSIFGFILLHGDGIERIPEVMKTNRDRGMFKKVRNFINFSTVESKIGNNEYECTEELLFDLRKIEHVMRIEFKECRRTKEIDHFIGLIRRYCIEITLCPHCIYNHYHTYLKSASICPWGHRLAAVYQSRNYTASFEIFNMKPKPDLPRYFPVKVISYSQCFNHVYVRLFDPEKPWSLKVPISNVNHLSKCDLEQFHGHVNDVDLRFPSQNLRKTYEGLKFHLEELKKKFGDLSSLPNKGFPWKKTDDLFINLKKKRVGQKKISRLPSGLENSKLDECRANQSKNSTKITKGSISSKRALELDVNNLSKKLSGQRTVNDLDTRHNDSLSETLPSGWLMKVAPHGRPYFVNEMTNAISWIDPRTNKPGPPPIYVASDAANVTTKKLFASIDKNIQDGQTEEKTQHKDPRSNQSGENGSISSPKIFSRSNSNLETLNPPTHQPSSVENKNDPEMFISEPFNQADVHAETLSENLRSPLISSDSTRKSLSSTPPDHDPFDEEVTLLEGNHFEGQPHKIESEKSMSRKEIIFIDISSDDEISDCEKSSEKFSNQETQHGKSDASSNVLGTLALSALESKSCEKIHFSDKFLTEECSHCHLLEGELDKKKKLLNYFDVNCKALLNYCSDLRENLTKDSI